MDSREGVHELAVAVGVAAQALPLTVAVDEGPESEEEYQGANPDTSGKSCRLYVDEGVVP